MKKTILILATVVLGFTGISQDFYHGAGAQMYVGLFETPSSSITGGSTEVLPIPGAFYKATLDFDEVFALSAYPFVGLAFQADAATGTGGGYFGAGVPVLIEKYFGDVDDECFYIGVGAEAAFVTATGFESGLVVGPTAGVGGQFYFRDNLVGIRAAYTFGVNKGNPMGIMGGIYYMFGQ
ncbi:MAG: hypothetical protein ABF242_10735 [Flavobacteriales bacterium]